MMQGTLSNTHMFKQKITVSTHDGMCACLSSATMLLRNSICSRYGSDHVKVTWLMSSLPNWGVGGGIQGSANSLFTVCWVRLEPRMATTQALIQILTIPCYFKNFPGRYLPECDACVSSRTWSMRWWKTAPEEKSRLMKKIGLEQTIKDTCDFVTRILQNRQKSS